MELQASAYSITWTLLFILKFDHHCPFLTLCSGAVSGRGGFGADGGEPRKGSVVPSFSPGHEEVGRPLFMAEPSYCPFSHVYFPSV